MEKFLGLIVGLITFIIIIRFWANIANHIGNEFRNLIEHLINLYQKRKKQF